MGRRRRGFELRLSGRAARVAGVAFGVGLLAVTIGCVVYSGGEPFAEAAEAPPVRVRPEPLERLDRIEAWIPSWGDEAALAREATTAGFTDLLFFHGSVAGDGSVKLEDSAGLKLGVAAAHGARTWLTVTNHGGALDHPLGAGLHAHADSLLEAFRRSGCGHLDLDYESLNLARARGLLRLAEYIAPRLPAGSRLSLTLQPVDSVLRPEQREVYREMLASPEIYTVRMMMYDYHWRNSLPGALCPIAAFERVVREWSEFAHKLTLCLPLYGYDWPRPEDTSLPRAETITLRDVGSRPGMDIVWMKQEAELAGRYEGHMVALPSLRAIQRRVELGLDWGVPAVAFWHLGCGRHAPVADASRRGVQPREAVSYDEGENWDGWIEPYKRRVCRVIIADGSQSLDAIARSHNVPRATLYRFNEHLTGADLAGQTVYIP